MDLVEDDQPPPVLPEIVLGQGKFCPVALRLEVEIERFLRLSDPEGKGRFSDLAWTEEGDGWKILE
jgi:hypothetical protein